MTGEPGPPYLSAIADILVELSEDIEQVGETLCSDPTIMSRVVTQLQSIDLMAQTQRQLAALLRADDPQEALEAVVLERLKHRLHAIQQPRSLSTGSCETWF